MPLEAWQRALRRQFGREQTFVLENAGSAPIFSEFRVTNPASERTYRVAIRGRAPGDNFCSCADFATNWLGTCKHVEFTLAALERRRGGRAALARGSTLPYSEVYLRYGPRRVIHFRPGTECPPSLRQVARRYFDADGALRPGSFDRFEEFLKRAAVPEHEVRCYPDVLDLVAEVRDTEHRRARLAELFPRGSRDRALDRLLSAPLYPYQREGALFAARTGRCLIADEMGLGKTVQALAATEILARHFGVERVLIVCPTSLKHQWEREIRRFTRRSVAVIGGLSTQRAEQLAADGFFKITNYDTLHRDVSGIGGWAPDLLILDEAQRIKNWETRAARSVKRIASRHAIVLTGTPLENRLEELVSIVDLVDSHRLGPTYRFLRRHQVLEGESTRVVGYRDLDQVGATLAPILLRRRKSEVLRELPKRIEKNLFVPMTREQLVHHDENQATVARIVHKWRKQRFLSEADQLRLRIALQNMRMSCDSTFLLDHRTDFGTKVAESMTLLDDVLEEPGVKVVIFSQWLGMHELIARRLEERGLDHVRFHGSLDQTARRTAVDRFREDEGCRIFLSTDAGGVGLNLQRASVVLNVDLPWNPAVLEQRIGRVHRLGQARPVRVVNLIAEGTIEHGILSLLGFKRSIFSGVLDDGAKEVFLGGARLAQFMETVSKATQNVPRVAEEDPGAEPVEPQVGEDAVRMEVARENQPYAGSRDQQPPAPRRHLTRAPVPAAPDLDLPRLLDLGASMLKDLARSLEGPTRSDGDGEARGPRPFATVRPDDDGEMLLTVRLPRPEVLEGVLEVATALLRALPGALADPKAAAARAGTSQ